MTMKKRESRREGRGGRGGGGAGGRLGPGGRTEKKKEKKRGGRGGGRRADQGGPTPACFLAPGPPRLPLFRVISMRPVFPHRFLPQLGRLGQHPASRLGRDPSPVLRAGQR